VPRGAFKPAPNVDSAVLSIQDIAGFGTPEEESWFFEVLRAGFAHKRKQLAKNLESLAGKERVQTALIKQSLPEKIRAEELSLADWRNLAGALAH
jgi:16S rRNA (adenine1518-N6/adenine1519-N6)-dimethyltransferase